MYSAVPQDYSLSLCTVSVKHRLFGLAKGGTHGNVSIDFSPPSMDLLDWPPKKVHFERNEMKYGIL